MAQTNINDGYFRRFDHGSRLVIRDQGALDSQLILNVVAGTARVIEGLETEMEPDTDRGSLLTEVRHGAERPSLISFDVKWTGAISAGELHEILRRGPSGGYLPKFQVSTWWADSPGAATGTLVVFDNCTRAEQSEISSGQDFDTLACRFRSTQPRGAWTATAPAPT